MRYSDKTTKAEPFTLGRLAKFMERMRALDVPEDAIVSVRMFLGGKLQEISVDTEKRTGA